MNVDQCTVNTLSLCSGGGGLDLGLELALGNARTVCWVEWEAFAAEFLASRMEAGCFPQAPIWTDLRTFYGKPWRGVVDCITAGYPCQPFSFAGRRGGTNDPRHLWPHVHRVIGEIEPRIVFAENVAGHLSLGFEQVVCDLQKLGYRVAAGLFTASEVGASHRRERLFILGLADAEHDEGRRQMQGRRSGRGIATAGPGRELAHAASGGTLAVQQSRRLRELVAESVGVADARRAERRSSTAEERDRSRGQRVRGQSEMAVQAAQRGGPMADAEYRRGSLPVPEGRDLFPPGPKAVEAWKVAPQHLWPATEPSLCGLVDGLAGDRTRWLRLLGNGVVPLQAAYAFVSLWAALTERDLNQEQREKHA